MRRMVRATMAQPRIARPLASARLPGAPVGTGAAA